MKQFFQIKRLFRDICNEKKSRYNETRQYIQHGRTSVMKHSLSVAAVSCQIAKRFNIDVDKKSMIRGALLHDYFLYDWHTKREGHNIHGFTHPYSALKNASRDFRLNPIEKNVIVRHMFPLTPIPPNCREAWIVCLADKYCSMGETMHTIKRIAREKKEGLAFWK